MGKVDYWACITQACNALLGFKILTFSLHAQTYIHHHLTNQTIYIGKYPQRTVLAYVDEGLEGMGELIVTLFFRIFFLFSKYLQFTYLIPKYSFHKIIL